MPGPTRPTGRGPEIVEVRPRHCPAGHPLTAGQVLVGSSPCVCGSHHRTYTCTVDDCGGMWVVPPHDAGGHKPLIDVR